MIRIGTPDGSVLEYKQLAICEFSSTRKRMSVVVRDLASQKIMLFSKGADSTMMNLIDRTNYQNMDNMKSVSKIINGFSVTGLRTLMLTEKVISEDEFNQWYMEYDEALNSIVDRDEKLAKVYAKIE